MTNQFIKQQQELAKESIIETFEDGTIRYCPRDLETQIEKIITNTGEELMRLVGSIDTYTGDDLADTCTKDIQTQAKQHITDLTSAK